MSDLPPSTSYPLPPTSYDYQSEGGALLLDAPTYVKRQADDDLYEGLKAGQFCYVLNARQMGKSSLKVRTLQRLRDEGIACAAVDLQGIGTSATEEQWYFGIISRIARSLGLHRQFNLNTWWTEQPRLSYVQRFVEFLESLLLPAVAEPIVIFIDEVDLTLNLAFRDDFFGALRESYNRRADEPEYRRLTFALFGVTTPSDLIQNKQTTPFNIGRPVDLTGLHLKEAQPLIPGLVAKAHNPQALLQAVLDWTGGQPFLTQKLCKLVQSAESAPLDGQENPWVEQLVQAKVIDNWEAQDIPPHLKTIRDRLLLSGEQRTGRLLGLYQQIVQQGEFAADDSPEQVELRLTGLVVRRDGKLRVYNRIYEQVFNRDWLERSLAELRPYGGAIAAWLESNPQDESRLLRGQTLQDARTWAEGKSLGDDDRRFLDASQELEKRDIQKKLDLEAEEKQILANANQKANRRIRFGSIALVSMLAIAIASGIAAQRDVTRAKQEKEQVVAEKNKLDDSLKATKTKEKVAENKAKTAEQQYQYAQQQVQQAKTQLEQVNQGKAQAEQAQITAEQAQITAEQKALQAEQRAEEAKDVASQAEILKQQAVSLQAEAEIGTKLELAGITAMNRFKTQETEGLVLAMRAGKKLQQLVKDGRSLEKYPATTPLLALQSILDNIRETRILTGKGRGRTGDVIYSPDGKLIAIRARPSDLDTRAYETTVVSIWNNQGKRIAILSGIEYVSFSPDSKYLAGFNSRNTGEVSGSDVIIQSGEVSLWEIEDEKIKKISNLKGDNWGPVFIPNKKELVTTGGKDGSTRSWNMQGELIGELKEPKRYSGIATSPNGKFLITTGSDGAGGDGFVRLWNLESKSFIELEGIDARNVRVSFSPDGTRIAVKTYGDKLLTLWDLKGKPLSQFNAKKIKVVSTEFSPDSRQIATGSSDGSIDLWNFQGEKLVELKGHTKSIWDIRFLSLGQEKGRAYTETSRDVLRLITHSEDGTVRLWTTQGNQLDVLKSSFGINHVEFSPDRKRFVTVEGNGTARIWEAKPNGFSELQEDKGRIYDVRVGALVQSIVFSPNGEQIITFSPDYSYRLWNLEDSPLATLKGNQGTLIDLTFSPDSQLVVTHDYGNTALLWKVTGEPIAKLEELKANILFGINSNLIESIFIGGMSPEGTIKLWNSKGQKITEIKAPSKERYGTYIDYNAQGQGVFKPTPVQNFFESVIVSSDGKQLLTRDDNTAYLWNPQGKLVAEFKSNQLAQFSPDSKFILTVDSNTVSAVNSTRNTDTVINKKNPSVRLWNIQGKFIATLDEQLDLFKGIEFSPDSKTIAILKQNGILRLWNTKRLSVLQYSVPPESSGISFRPNSQLIAISRELKEGGKEEFLYMDIVNGRIIKDSRSIEGTYSPDLKIVATSRSAPGEGSSIVQLWNNEGRLLTELLGHQEGSEIVGFSPDSKRVMTVGFGLDNTIRIWDIRGRQIAQYAGREVAVSPDWQHLAALNRFPGEENEVTKIWRIDNLDLLLDRACQRLHYYLLYRPELESDRQMCGITSKK